MDDELNKNQQAFNSQEGSGAANDEAPSPWQNESAASANPEPQSAGDTTPITVNRPESSPVASPAWSQSPNLSGDSNQFSQSDSLPPLVPTSQATIITSKPRSKKKWFIFGGGLAVVLVAALLTYFLWYQKPTKVLADAFGQFVTAKNMTYSGALDTANSGSNFSLDYTGAVNNDSEAVNVTAKINATGQTITVPLSVIRNNSKEFYFKIDQLKKLSDQFMAPMLAMYGATAQQQTSLNTIVSSIDGQWYKVTLSDITGNTQDTKSSDCISSQIDKIRSDKATQDELGKVYDQHPLFKVTKELGTQNGNLGYMVTPASDSDTKAFVQALIQTNFYKDLQRCDSSIKLDPNQFAGDNTPFDGTIEVQVSQWTHQLAGITVHSSSKSGDKLTLTFAPKIGDIQKIETPQNAKPFTELKAEIDNLTTSLSGGAQTSSASTAAAQEQAMMVMNKAEAYNAKFGQYPATIADFAKATGSQLPDPSSVVSTLPQDSQHVAYRRCSAKGGEVVYRNLATNQYLAIAVGVGPSGVVTQLC